MEKTKLEETIEELEKELEEIEAEESKEEN